MAFNHESFREAKAYKSAYIKNRGRVKCKVCELYICICQVNLIGFVDVSQVIKNPSHSQKVANCPHRCANSTICCLDCYDYDKFKGVVSL